MHILYVILLLTEYIFKSHNYLLFEYVYSVKIF